MAKNAVLQRHAESAMQVARAQSEVRGETAHVYTDTRYAAGTWDHERRVVIDAGDLVPSGHRCDALRFSAEEWTPLGRTR